jgi:hypothetical protein
VGNFVKAGVETPVKTLIPGRTTPVTVGDAASASPGQVTYQLGRFAGMVRSTNGTVWFDLFHRMRLRADPLITQPRVLAFAPLLSYLSPKKQAAHLVLILDDSTARGDVQYALIRSHDEQPPWLVDAMIPPCVVLESLAMSV